MLPDFLPTCSRIPDLRHGQGWLHLQRRTVPGAQDDGGQQPERHTAAADCGQNHHQRRQGRRRQDIVRGVLRGESRDSADFFCDDCVFADVIVNDADQNISIYGSMQVFTVFEQNMTFPMAT